MTLFWWLVAYSVMLAPIAAYMSPAKDKLTATGFYYSAILLSTIGVSYIPYFQ